MLPGGGRTPEVYPSATSWELVLRALVAQHPRRPGLPGRQASPERAHRHRLQPGRFDWPRRAVPRAVDVLDAPIVDQLAAVTGCDVFVAPHTPAC